MYEYVRSIMLNEDIIVEPITDKNMKEATIVGYNIKPIIDINIKGLEVNKFSSKMISNEAKERVLGLWIHVVPDGESIQYDFVFVIDRFLFDNSIYEQSRIEAGLINQPFKRYKVKKLIKRLKRLKETGIRAVFTEPMLASWLHHFGVNDLSELKDKRIKIFSLESYEKCPTNYIPAIYIPISEEYKKQFPLVHNSNIVISDYFNFKNISGKMENINTNFTMMKNFCEGIVRDQKDKEDYYPGDINAVLNIKKVDPDILYDPLRFEYDFEKKVEL